MRKREDKKKHREGVRNDLLQRRAERRARRRMLSSEAESGPRITLARRLGWTVRESWWSLQERVLWPLADWSRLGFDAARWPFEHLAWTVRERLVWPLQDRLAERPAGSGRMPKAATASVLAVLALGSLGAGAIVASGGDDAKAPETSTPVVAQTVPEIDDPAPLLAKTEPEPTGPVLEGPRPKFGAASEAERRKARAALRKLKKEEAKQGAVGADVEATAAGAEQVSEEASAGSDSGSSGSDATTGTVTDPVTGATASNAAAARKARRKESPLSVAERFAIAFVSYEIGGKGGAIDATFKDTADQDLFKSLQDRPPRQPKGGKVPKARVWTVVGGPRKKNSMEVSVSLVRVDGTSELRLEMTRIDRGWVVKTVRG